MKLIRVRNESPEKFARKVQKALFKGPLGRVTQFTFEPPEFVISFSQLGSSNISYLIEDVQNGFVAKLSQEKISALHSAFKKDIEKELTRIMSRFGAEIE